MFKFIRKVKEAFETIEKLQKQIREVETKRVDDILRLRRDLTDTQKQVCGENMLFYVTIHTREALRFAQVVGVVRLPTEVFRHCPESPSLLKWWEKKTPKSTSVYRVLDQSGSKLLIGNETLGPVWVHASHVVLDGV